MTNQEQAYYNSLKKETAEIEHQGRKQWPTSWTDSYSTHQTRRGIPTNFITPQKYLNMTIRRSVKILDVIQIAEELKMADRKTEDFITASHLQKNGRIHTYHIAWFIQTLRKFPSRTKDPVANLEECPVCEGHGCSLCWGYSLPSTPQNYQGGRE